MRKKYWMLICLGAAGVLGLIIPSTALTQFGGGKGKGQPGGGGFQPGGGGFQPGGGGFQPGGGGFQPGGGKGFQPGGGGFQPGGNQGGGNQKGGGMLADPGKLFDQMSKGKDYISIADFKMFRDPLQQWANENGVSSGQLNREQFTRFGTWMQEKIASGQGNIGKGGGPGGGKGLDQNPEQVAADRFKLADRNGDGKLNFDEMSDRLKQSWKTYDTNNDGFIDLDEYKAYYSAAVQQISGNSKDGKDIATITIVIEEEWDKRPTVFRAGKLPKELPEWFARLDTDKDGQVGFYEWKKDSKDSAEFDGYDRNGDGLVTAEEVLFQIRALAKLNSTTTTIAQNPNGRGPGGQMSWNNMPGGNNGDPRQKGPKGGFPGSGGENPFGKGKGGEGGNPFGKGKKGGG